MRRPGATIATPTRPTRRATIPTWDSPSRSYLAGGKEFGPIVSRNITPDEHGLPAGLTLAEFKRVLRTGHDPDDPGELLQVMPWPVFQDMTDQDLRAIYEYLRSIPSLDSPYTEP